MSQKKQQKPRGRPHLPDSELRAERVVTFLTSEQKQKLKRYADASALSLSTAAQNLIRQSLSDPDISPKTPTEGKP